MIVGKNVKISPKASLYGTANICIGNNVRIDDFCILSAGKGGIEIGNNVHIACYSCLIGAGKITLCDFSGISVRTVILSSTDDFSGQFLSGPTLPEEFLCVCSAPVTIGKHVIIGAGSVVMPGAHVKIGAAIGALSFVAKDIPEFEIWAGNPIRKIKNRDKKLLELEKKYTRGKY